MGLVLKPLSNKSINNNLSFNADEINIGREFSNDLVIDDIEVSRRHAKITYTDSHGYQLEDLNSTYGTFVNGKRITKRSIIKLGDKIGLGSKTLFEIYELDDWQICPEEKSEITETSPMRKVMIETSDQQFDKKDKEKNVESANISIIRLLKIKINNIKLLPRWQIVLLIGLFFLIIFCLIPILIIESTNQWCHLFSGFFNTISPGICS